MAILTEEQWQSILSRQINVYEIHHDLGKTF